MIKISATYRKHMLAVKGPIYLIALLTKFTLFTRQVAMNIVINTLYKHILKTSLLMCY